MEKISEIIIRFKWAVVIAVLIITGFLGYQIKDMSIDSDIISSLPRDDSTAVLYTKIGNKYGGNTMGMIILQTDDIFKTGVLQDIKQITDSIRYIEGISSVTSLTDVLDIRDSEEGIIIGKLVDEYELPQTQHQLDSLKSYIFSKEMYKGSLISEDATSTVVLFSLLEDANKKEVAKIVKSRVNSLHLSEKISFGGMPMMMEDVAELMVVDMLNLIPFTALIIILILFLSFRSLQGVLLPLLTSGIAIIWVVGIMQLSGYQLNLISMNMPVILLAIGSAYSIHVINRINECREKDQRKALIMALAYIIIPVFLSGITTVFGFVSFIFGAYLTMIRDFGIFTSIGVVFSLFLSLVFIPAVVSIFTRSKNKKLQNRKSGNQNMFGKYILIPISNGVIKYPKIISLVWGILMLISVYGIVNIKTSINMAEYFQKDNPTRITEDIMQKEFGGSLPVFVVFTGDMQSPAVLKKMDETEEYMKQFAEVSSAQSVADLIKQMNGIMGEGKKVPSERDKIEQLWFLLDGQEIMEQLVAPDLDEGIIQSKFASEDTKVMKEFMSYMDEFIQKKSTEECKIRLTGMPSVYVKLNDSLIRSQFTSLTMAIILVIFIVALILKSFSKGIYAAIPIITTIIILFGFMGTTGISLNIATVLVASVALGMGIDYSIHIITHFTHKIRESDNLNEAISETIMVSGRAVIINVISVSAGFLVLQFSHMVPIQDFGLLVALSMFGSGLGALTLLPVILYFDYKRKYKSKNIS